MLEYLLERFLYRVSIHPLGQQHFVLKGGLLLAQFGARRVTRDIGRRDRRGGGPAGDQHVDDRDDPRDRWGGAPRPTLMTPDGTRGLRWSGAAVRSTKSL